MPQPNDLSRSPAALDQDSTLIAVIEMSQSSWLVAGTVTAGDDDCFGVGAFAADAVASAAGAVLVAASSRSCTFVSLRNSSIMRVICAASMGTFPLPIISITCKHNSQIPKQENVYAHRLKF